MVADFMFFGRKWKESCPQRAARERWRFEAWPSAVYAIGDIHGCLDELETLVGRIEADAAGISGERWIIALGDYADRGKDSAGVIDYLVRWSREDFRLFCLAGNHDVIMHEVLADPSQIERWWALGCEATLRSYGIDPTAFSRGGRSARVNMLARHIPRAHRQFLGDLPVAVALPGAVFVHAGLRPGIELNEQSEQDLLWMRYGQTDAEAVPEGLVVHGHTPVSEPIRTNGRICIDTGAFATGTLSALRLKPDGTLMLLNNR